MINTMYTGKMVRAAAELRKCLEMLIVKKTYCVV